MRPCAASARAPPPSRRGERTRRACPAPEQHSDRSDLPPVGSDRGRGRRGVIAGLILDISIAFRFGAGAKTDAFFVAARIPIGLVAVVMAAANQALVPAFRTSLTQRGERSTDHLISMVLCAVVIVGAALVLADVARRVAAGARHGTGLSRSARVSTAASMVPVMFAMVPLVAIAEVMRAYLNARYAFVAPALMTVVLNGLAAAMIIVLPLLAAARHILLVAFAFLAGAAAQVVFMCAHGGRVRACGSGRRSTFVTSSCAASAKLCVRPLGAAGLNPVARLGEQLMVSFLPTGIDHRSQLRLLWSTRRLAARSSSARSSSRWSRGSPTRTISAEQAEVRRFTGLGVRIMLAISLPLTAFMAVLGKPAAVAVFDRGKFTLAPGRPARARCWSSTRSASSGPRCSARCSRPSTPGSTHERRCATPCTASRPTWSCCRCSCCRSVLHPAGDHRRRPRLLARPVRQRRTRLVSALASRRQSLRGARPVRVKLADRVGAQRRGHDRGVHRARSRRIECRPRRSC